MRAFVLAILVLGTVPALGTTVEPLDEQALAERSDLIARVMVTGARAERVGRRVLTFYQLDVVDVWRSRDQAPPRQVTLALPGGVIDVDGRSLGQLVPGTPVLAVGSSYVLCLGDDVGPKGARGLVGLWQGAFAVLPRGSGPGSAAGHAERSAAGHAERSAAGHAERSAAGTNDGRLRAFVHGGAGPILDEAALRLRLRAGAR